MPINSFLYPGAKVVTGYNVDNSLRFNDGSSDTLSRTPSSASNRKTFTISIWFKKTVTGVQQRIFDASTGQDDQASLLYNSSDQLQVYFTTGGTTNIYLNTNRLLRDVSAWYHIVVAVDTTQATSSNRAKLYINGVQETSFANETYPSQNIDTLVNSTNQHRFGSSWVPNQYLDGYLCETVLIDGSQLDPTSFGEFDEDSGIWKPIDVSGLTFGTNGFYLDFEDSSALGNDVSGNNNDFTVNNLTSIDQTTDTCTNNYATMNPLSSLSTFSEGNNTIIFSSGSGYQSSTSTIGITQGKWYAEMKIQVASSNYPGVGIAATNSLVASKMDSDWLGEHSDTYGYFLDGEIYNNGSTVTTGQTTFTTGDIVGLALDLDSSQNTLKFYKNGSLVYTLNINTNSNGYMFGSVTQSTTSSAKAQWNFGNPPFSITSGNSDGNGYGNFEYSVPSGYYALNTKNLAEYG